MCLLEVLTGIKEIAITAAAGFGIYAAWHGLDVWRNQLYGTTEFDLARRTLAAMYEYRNTLSNLSNTIEWFSIRPDILEGTNAYLEDENTAFYSVKHFYEDGDGATNTAKSHLEMTLLESEAVFGNELKYLFDDLFKLEEAVKERITAESFFLHPDEYNTVPDKKELFKYTLLDQDKCKELTKTYNKAKEDIEAFLRPKLSLKRQVQDQTI